jgi:hypothetical protein
MAGFTGNLSVIPSHMTAIVNDVVIDAGGISCSWALRKPNGACKQKNTPKKNKVAMNGLIFTCTLFIPFKLNMHVIAWMLIENRKRSFPSAVKLARKPTGATNNDSE